VLTGSHVAYAHKSLLIYFLNVLDFKTNKCLFVHYQAAAETEMKSDEALTDEQEKQLVDAINSKRSSQGASNMNKIVSHAISVFGCKTIEVHREIFPTYDQ
jgi:hypothetical protein